MSVKTSKMLYKSCLSEVKDIDEKGNVIFYASINNTPDRVKEVVDKGAFNKSISENYSEIQHYKNHDPELMPGVLKELSEDDHGLKAVSKLIMDTQIGSETYAQYKAMAEAGKSMGHSIGYAVVRDNKMSGDGYRHLKEIALFEVSTLTKRAAHPDALTVGIKELTNLEIEDLIKEEAFYKSLLNYDFKDADLKRMEELKNHISALINARRKDAPANSTPQKIVVKPFKIN